MSARGASLDSRDHARRIACDHGEGDQSGTAMVAALSEGAVYFVVEYFHSQRSMPYDTGWQFVS